MVDPVIFENDPIGTSSGHLTVHISLVHWREWSGSSRAMHTKYACFLALHGNLHECFLHE